MTARGVGSAFSTAMAAVAILIASYMLVSSYLSVHISAGSLITFHDVRFLQDSAHPGDVVELRIDRTRDRYCPGVVVQRWIREDDGEILNEALVAAGVTRITGRHTTILRKEIPERAAPGRVCYAPILTYQCPAASHTILQPPACIDVEL